MSAHQPTKENEMNTTYLCFECDWAQTQDAPCDLCGGSCEEIDDETAKDTK